MVEWIPSIEVPPPLRDRISTLLPDVLVSLPSCSLPPSHRVGIGLPERNINVRVSKTPGWCTQRMSSPPLPSDSSMACHSATDFIHRFNLEFSFKKTNSTFLVYILIGTSAQTMSPRVDDKLYNHRGGFPDLLLPVCVCVCARRNLFW